MEVKELRIGNLVRHKSFGIVEIKGINEGSIKCQYKGNTYWDDLSFFKPIKLTEKWFPKFEFEYEDLHDDSPYEWYKKEELEIWNFNGKHWIVNCLDQFGIDQSHFKYVHQLQNIYFETQNEELTIK